MPDFSGRFALPLLQAGQAQKELFHNEALAAIDAVLHPVAQSLGEDDPPVSPAIGQCWIAGTAPTGAWAGHADDLACWTSGGWRFAAPVEGMRVWLSGDGVWTKWLSGAWGVEGAVADPAGGAVVDIEARAAISALLAVARSHGLIAG